MTDLGRERRHWEDLAVTDPMWVILTEPGKKERWDPAEFFASGRREIADVFAELERLGIHPRAGVAVDFGCGLGRLSQALADRFEHVHGVDISETMVAQAAAHNAHGARVEYHANMRDQLPMLPTASVDFIYSRITLQHVPRAIAERYIAEFGRALAAGGVCVFQVPVRAKRLSVRLRHAIRNAFPELYRNLRDLVTARSRWELNTIPERSVTRILERAGLRIRAVVPDDSAGEPFESRIFIATRD